MKINFPENININYPDRLILTIYSGEEHFSLSLHNPEEKGSYFYMELTAENQADAFSAFKETFFDNTFFSLPFRKVSIMNRTPLFIFIPNSIYEKKSREDFLQFLLPENQGITLNHIVSYTGISVLYQLPEDVYNFMLRSFSEPEFIHYSAPMITYFLEKVKNISNRRMVVNLQGKGLDIFCFSRDTFLLGNYFPCNSLSEALYYILFTWKQLQFNQLNDYLHIAGEAVFKEELIGKLALYLQQIHQLAIPPANHFEGIETDRIPIELAMLSLCGL